MKHLACLTVAFSLLVGCKTTSENVRFPTPAWATNAPATIRAKILRPPGDGPFAAVIVLHGCGGVDSHHTGWAETLVSWGYVAMVVDSFSPRGQQNVCANVNAVTPRSRTSDIAGAAEYLNGQSYVAKGHIGLLGFSHGGWTIMKAVQANNRLKDQGVKAAVAYYPYCDPVDDVDVDLPLLVLIGADDNWTPSDRCKRLHTSPALMNADQVQMVFYPGAYHAFDRFGAMQEVKGQGEGGALESRRIGYDAAAAKDAMQRTATFLDKHLQTGFR